MTPLGSYASHVYDIIVIIIVPMLGHFAHYKYKDVLHESPDLRAEIVGTPTKQGNILMTRNQSVYYHQMRWWW